MEIYTLLQMLATIFTFFIIYMCWNFLVFPKQGIKLSSYPIPVFGTLLPWFLKGSSEMFEVKLKELGKTWGDYAGRVPILTTCDTDIIRQVFIKEHTAFPARRSVKTGNDMNDMMILNVDDYGQWKYLRDVLSPAFSSGKLKKMMVQINKCALQMRSNIIKHSEAKKAIEVQRFSGSFTMDVIASIAFGIDINTEQDVDNEFVKHAKNALDININQPLFILYLLFPSIVQYASWLNLNVFDKKAENFFTDVVKQAMQGRKRDVERVDFLQLLINAYRNNKDSMGERTKNTKGRLKETELLAQGWAFFLTGYDTTAVTISFLAYNLSCFPEKQELLLEEIDHVVKDNDMFITEKELNEMPYLDMCVNETLRLYPPLPVVTRVAVKDVQVNGINIPKNGCVRVPIYAMHHHEGFYPNPEEFIPERFSPEEKASRDPLLFMPFGAGPRQCIAPRLAITEVKIAMCHILKTHKFVRAPATEVPIQFTSFGLLKLKNGIWLHLEKRIS